MARRPAPSPVDLAIQHLGKLSAAGTSPARMERAARAVVAGWVALEDSDRAQRFTSQLRSDLASGLTEAEEQAGDADASEPGAVKHAQAMVAALRATVQALTDELGRM